MSKEREHTYVSLRAALQGHSKPKECVYTIIGWLSALSPPPGWEHDAQMRAQIYGLRNLMFAWATMPRTLKDVYDMDRITCTCADDAEASDTTAHSTGRYQMEAAQAITPDIRPMSIVLKAAFVPLFILVTEGPKGTGSLPRAKKIKARCRWPTSVRELLPHGPESTVRGLLIWLHGSYHGNIYTSALYMSILALVHMCHSYIMPYISTSRTLLNRGVISWIRFLYRDLMEMMKHCTRSISETNIILERFMVLGAFFSRIYTLYMDLTLRHHFTATFAAELLQACAMALDAYDIFVRDPFVAGLSTPMYGSIDDFSASFQKIASTLLLEYPDLAITNPDGRAMAIFRHNVARERSSGRAPWKRFLQIIYALVTRERCCAPGCAVTSADTKLRYCAVCRRVSYCSITCQKRAWNMNTCAHRDICHAIRLLCTHFKLRRNSGAILAIHNNRKKPSNKELSDWQPLYETVSNHFDELSRVELQTPCKRPHHSLGHALY
jgi:hypothetical protein